MRSVAFALAVAALVAPAGGAPIGPNAQETTEVLRAGPLDASGYVKKSLKVTFVKGGACVDIGYTYVGSIAYRCRAGNWLFNGCWREGPMQTEFVICMGAPWDTNVVRLRSRHLVLYPGVTYGPARTVPWGIELRDGTRCFILQGAHDAIHARGRTFIVDYGCRRSNVVLLREGLRRGRVWHANVARWSRKQGRYTLLDEVPLRRVYFGFLPPPLARQHAAASAAVTAARRIILRRQPRARLDLEWVRLTLPDAQWAHIIFSSVDNHGWYAVLRRVNGRWTDASRYRPYCENVPRRVRTQLFLDRRTWNPPPDRLLTPPGEIRC